MTIKEALEQLKIKVDDISAWKTIVEILEIKLSNVEKENLKLKKAYTSVNEELHCAFARGVDSARFDVLEENQKLKKAIEILNETFEFELRYNQYGYFLISDYGYGSESFMLTKEEYELLKEVLVNE